MSMLAFGLTAAGLTILTLMILVRPLLTRAAAASGEQDKRLAVYRQQFAELEQDYRNAVLTADQFQAARRELERRLLEETGSADGLAPGVVLPVKVKTVAVLVAVVVPVASALLYWKLGAPQVITNPDVLMAQRSADGGQGAMSGLTAMTERLKKRLEQNPNDPPGWALLARAYAEIGRHAEAVPIFEKAVQMSPPDAQLLADYADALAVSQGRMLKGKPEELIERAMKIDPNNVKVLLLAGTVAYNKKEFSRAATLWEQARANLPPQTEAAAIQELIDGIVEARQLAGEKPVPMAAAKPSAPAKPAAPGGQAAAVTGTVTLAPALAAKGSPTDTLFVFAREVNGPPMPVSIVRATKKDLPFTFRLDDSNSPMPARPLSQVSSVVIVARLSKSGQAVPKSGDLQGMSQPLKPGAGSVHVTIDQEIP